MQYHLETIPLWDAIKAETPCLLCALYEKNEETQIDYTLGGSVMEPEERIRVNHTGFCQKHQRMIYDRQNRLGHALMLDSHAREIQDRLKATESKEKNCSGRGGLLKKQDSLREVIRSLESLTSGCVVCQEIDSAMERYTYTFVQLWKSDPELRRAFEESKGLCIPHTVQVLKAADQFLSGQSRQEFVLAVTGMLRRQMETDEKDLEWFTLKFDYRNDDKPWGNSRDAVERMANRLRGRCIGEQKTQDSDG